MQRPFEQSSNGRVIWEYLKNGLLRYSVADFALQKSDSIWKVSFKHLSNINNHNRSPMALRGRFTKNRAKRKNLQHYFS